MKPVSRILIGGLLATAPLPLCAVIAGCGGGNSGPAVPGPVMPQPLT